MKRQAIDMGRDAFAYSVVPYENWPTCTECGERFKSVRWIQEGGRNKHLCDGCLENVELIKEMNKI